MSPRNSLFVMSFLGLLVVFSGLAQAQESVPHDEIEIDPRACQSVTHHTPRADVTYQAGVDVYGQPVAPADLEDQNSSQALGQSMLSAVSVPITLDVAQFLGLKKPIAKGADTKAVIGVLSFSADRTALFNGEPLTDLQKSKLSDLCSE